MGSFANAIFNLLLGWVRTAARGLWALITGRGGELVAWLADNWLALTIVLCVVCTLIDMVIHLIRWRPYKVWASFLRRITGRERGQHRMQQRQTKTEPSEVQNPVDQPEEMYAAPQPALQQNIPEDQEAYRSRFARPEQPVYAQPAELSRLQYQAIRRDEPAAPEGLAGYPQPMQEAAAEPPQEPPVSDTRPYQPLPRESLSHQMRRRMSQLQKNLGLSDDDMEVNYRPAKPVVDEKEMYHAPVYPPDWPQQQTTPRRRRQPNDFGNNA